MHGGPLEELAVVKTHALVEQELQIVQNELVAVGIELLRILGFNALANVKAWACSAVERCRASVTSYPK